MKLFFCFFFLFVLIHVNCTSECTYKDYGAIYGECSEQTNIRSASYYWHEPKTCEGGDSLPDSFVEVDCSCTYQDYKPIYGECQFGTREKSYEKETDCTNGTDPAPEQVPCECTQNDYDGIYNECDQGKRDLKYVWKIPKKCEGGVALPETLKNLNCYIECDPGYYLPKGETICNNCKSGTYSFGSGTEYIEWEDWPSGKFQTYCQNSTTAMPTETNIHLKDETECKGWELKGTYISSGNYGYASSNSTLEYWDNFLGETENAIAFRFLVDSEEKSDGLLFYIDEELKLGLVSSEIYPKTVKFDLTKGVHQFKWIYLKDDTDDHGLDKAKIEEITLIGTEPLTSECFNCPLGYSSNDTSSGCEECPRNYYKDQEGEGKCLECDSRHYSNPGSATCEERQPCTESDWEWYYSYCNASHLRTKIWRLIDPVICDTNRGVTPDDKLSEPGKPCEECVPGEIEVEKIENDETVYVCEYCPNGTKRAENEDECTPCPAGTEALKSKYYQDFDRWPHDFQTSCSGDCGTSGWRLVDDYLDSGTGHDDDVESYLEYDFHSESKGYIKIDFDLQCTDDFFSFLIKKCGVTFYLDGESKKSYKSDQFDDKKITISFSDAGDHKLIIKFWKAYFYYISGSNHDVTRVKSISVHGLKEGGSDDCVECNKGLFSKGKVSSCTLCALGNYSNIFGATTCHECPENTFNDYYGSTKCVNCGAGTFSNAGSTECDNNNCTYRINELIEYDLKPLASSNQIFKKLHSNQIFKINICYKNEEVDYCKDEYGNAIKTFICQNITDLPSQYDLGNTIEYLPLDTSQDDANKSSFDGDGLLIRYLNGKKCSNGIYRYTNISLICDMGAGMGEPEAGSDGVEKDTCTYEFIWKSMYACPLCTESDYDYYYTPCEEDEFRYKHYYWLQNPKKCYGGVELPEDEMLSCTGDIVCEKGTFFNGNNCTVCNVGEHSYGEDLLFEYQNLNQLEASTPPQPTTRTTTTTTTYFSTGCLGNLCTNWTYDSNLLKSGNGEITWLKINQNFHKVGQLIFEYNSILTKDNLQFLFKIDGEEILSKKSPYFEKKFIQYQHKLNSEGTHQFEWIIINNDYNNNHNDGNYSQEVQIKKILFQNAEKYKHKCLTCDAGTFANEKESDICNICNENTFSNSPGSTYCKNCSDLQFSYSRATECINRRICNENDYYIEYDECDPKHINRTAVYKLYQPQICLDDDDHLDNDFHSLYDENVFFNVSCNPCNQGEYYDQLNYKCVDCQDGSYSKEYNSLECEKSDIGFITINSIEYHYFENTHSQNSKFEKEIKTYCSGYGCGYSSGWRLRNEYIDSGINSKIGGSFNSIIDFKDSFHIILDDDSGYLELEIKLNQTQSNLIILLNEQPKLEINSLIEDFQAFQIPLKNGIYNLSIIFNKWGEEISTGKAFIRKIDFFGTLSGTSKNQYSCKSGSYSPESGATKCLLCQRGSYSIENGEGDGSGSGISKCNLCSKNQFNDKEGSNLCYKCGEGTWGNKEIGSTDCLNDCKYQIEKGKSFNFNQIPSQIYEINDSNDNTSIALSLCSKISNNKICNDQNSFICKESNSFGNILNFHYPLPLDKYPDDSGLIIEYLSLNQMEGIDSDFDSSGNNNNDGGHLVHQELVESNKKTILYMVCDQKSGIGSPNVIEEDVNQLVLEWRSLYSCRECDSSEINTKKSSCKNGQKTITVTHPEDCWIITDQSESEKCSSYEVKLYIIYIGSSVFFILLIFLVFIYWQKYKVHKKYTQINKQKHDKEEAIFEEDVQSINLDEMEKKDEIASEISLSDNISQGATKIDKEKIHQDNFLKSSDDDDDQKKILSSSEKD
ncbi:hypothetical protein M0812_03884 [Anaeramoeba flamelloides]|uniref:MRH domain-containing protein n=1 Tax=Anaeramoeba flamelloides TaxID=1746091 RepID=A0AAV8AEN3_9EUKA|nr:hypothetical protein M0812_03884 [Anaeramoeba flamelloides]